MKEKEIPENPPEFDPEAYTNPILEECYRIKAEISAQFKTPAEAATLPYRYLWVDMVRQAYETSEPWHCNRRLLVQGQLYYTLFDVSSVFYTLGFIVICI